MKKLIKEFRDFALKGSVIDLAVAVIMGGAASKMVSSLVESILMPLLGVLLGGVDFSTLSIAVGDARIMYGMFIQSAIDFLIVSLCVFFIIKTIKKFNQSVMHKEDEEKKLTTDDYLIEIRDLLAKQNRG